MNKAKGNNKTGQNTTVYTVQSQGREQNKKRHKRRRSRNTAMLYIMVLLFMLTVGVVLIFTVFFKVITIDIEGLSRYEPQEVIASTGIAVGENMFRLNRGEIESSLEKNYSYFETVKLKYRLPDTIIIQVHEAQPVGAIKQGESYLMISQSGRVLESIADNPPAGIVVVKGFSALPVKVGLTLEQMLEEQKESLKLAQELPPLATQEEKNAKKQELAATALLNKETSGKVDMMQAFFKSSAEEGFTVVNTIDVSDQFNLLAISGRATLEFGAESELNYKMQCVKKVFDEKLGDNFEGTVDASYAGRVRVRRISAQEQGMTPDEYAQYLYKQSGGVDTTLQETSPLPETSPKAPSSAAAAPPAKEKEPKTELLPEASSQEQDENIIAGDGFDWEVIDVE